MRITTALMILGLVGAAMNLDQIQAMLAPAPPSSAATAPDGVRVELFVTQTCGACRQAIAQLEASEVPYIAYDVNRSRQARGLKCGTDHV